MPDSEPAEPLEEARAGLPDVSTEMSVYWKPLRRLLAEGRQIGPVTILLYDLDPQKRLPFAALAKTRDNRLILWPPTHAQEPHEFDTGDAIPVHHVTLELSNGKTHFTRFEENSRRMHEKRGWKCLDCEGGLKLWLICAFRTEYLERQIGVVGGDVAMPKRDAGRRPREFVRYGEQMTSVLVPTPPLRGDCLVTVIHLLPDRVPFQGPFERSHFPMGSFWNDWIADWPDGDKFQAATAVVNIGGVNLLLLTAAPLGRLRAACLIGSAEGQ